MRTWTGCCGLAALMSMGSSAHAMQANDVLMRRPIPAMGRSDIPTVQPGGVDPKQAIPPALVSGGYEPADPVDPDHTVDLEYYYWEVGDWQGSGACGDSDARLHRGVSCVSTFTGAPGSPAEWDYVQRRVDPSLCPMPAPATSMSGQGANCSYELVVSDWSPWSSSCASSAVRTRSVSCVRSDGVAVHLDFCRLNLQDGGTPYEQDVSTREEGPSYGGCRVKWAYHYEGSPASNRCTGSPPSYSYNYVPRCVVAEAWTQGVVLADVMAKSGESNESVCVRQGHGPSPRNDPAEALACNFYDNRSGRACSGQIIKDGTMKLSYSQNGSVFDTAYRFCSGMRAACMTVSNDPKDAMAGDPTPASGRFRTITCHSGYDLVPRTGLPAVEAGGASFTAFGANPPAYQWRDVPLAELIDR